MMNFSNSNILPNELPIIEDVEFISLEKDYLKVERISFFITVIIISVVVSLAFYFIRALQIEALIYTAVGILTFLFSLFWLAVGFDFRYSGYALREKDLLFRSGWLFRKTRVVPLNRVQHVSVQSGPIERKFGLASISIYTAGASNADFTINGISEQTAQQIKAWVSRQLHGTDLEQSI